MSTLAAPYGLDSAAVVFFGGYGEVTGQARQRQVPRQQLYREAHAVAAAVEAQRNPQHQAEYQQRLSQLHEQLRQVEDRLAQAVVIDQDKQSEFVATAQALGVSLSTARCLLAVFLGAATPPRATLGRRSQAAGRRAGRLLAVLDEYSRPRARQIAADEIFAGRKPILMTIEQASLCWLSGRLADKRDGPTWAEELRPLSAAEQVTADGGRGIRVALRLVNKERKGARQTAIADQRDHFHALSRARKGVHCSRRQAAKTLAAAEKWQADYDKDGRAGRPRSAAQGLRLKRAWHKAEQAFDRWSADEAAFTRLRQALRLFRPTGELNTRAWAEAEVATALEGRLGLEWGRARALLGPTAFTFLDKVQEQLAALPVEEPLRQAAVHIESGKRQAECRQAEARKAALARVAYCVAAVILALAKESGQQALMLVQSVLRHACRSSSLVEGLNSVLRMQQARQKRVTQELLDLKRLYWNIHEFEAGKRKRTTPYGRLGVVLPDARWWQLLKMTPEQLRQKLSALNPNTVRLSASHSLLIPCVCSKPRFQGGCDNDAARTLLGFGARCARHCGPVGRSQQGYLSGDHGASPVGNWTRPTTGLYVVASRDALGRAGNGYSHSSADPTGFQIRAADAFWR